MKRLLAILFVITMLAVATACGNDTTTAPVGDETTTTTEVDEATTTQTTDDTETDATTTTETTIDTETVKTTVATTTAATTKATTTATTTTASTTTTTTAATTKATTTATTATAFTATTTATTTASTTASTATTTATTTASTTSFKDVKYSMELADADWEYMHRAYNGELQVWYIYFKDESYEFLAGMPARVQMTQAELDEQLKQDPYGFIEYNGVYYCIGRGDGDGFASIVEESNVITITDLEGGVMVLHRTGNMLLEVISNNTTMDLPAGAQFHVYGM